MNYELYYDGTLEGLFALLDQLWTGILPEEGRFRRAAYPGGPGPGPDSKNPQGDLFTEDPAAGAAPLPDPGGSPLQASPNEPGPPGLLPEPADLGGAAGILYRVSADAYDSLVYTWMSGFSLEVQALRYALRVLSAAWEAARAGGAAEPPGGALPEGPAPSAPPWYTRGEARKGAALAARNRHDEDCRTVLAAAYQVAHEIDRLMGFLRFKPGANGRYIARCAPDHFVLPALAPHFTRRFGDTPWAIIDEKRGLTLVRDGGDCQILVTGEAPPSLEDPWERLWQCYHRTINIESRNNSRLQRRFIPLRYRDYLSEFDRRPDRSPGNCN
jgi:hypothetical protein